MLLKYPVACMLSYIHISIERVYLHGAPSFAYLNGAPSFAYLHTYCGCRMNNCSGMDVYVANDVRLVFAIGRQELWMRPMVDVEIMSIGIDSSTDKRHTHMLN